MTFRTTLLPLGLAAVAALAAPAAAFAQAGAFGGGNGPPLVTVPPPRQFASSEEHYKFLLEQAKGGTKHTLATVPATITVSIPACSRVARMPEGRNSTQRLVY